MILHKKNLGDWFALVDVNTSKIAWVPISILDEQKKTLSFRRELPSNNQRKNIRMFDDYTTFPFNVE